MWQAATSKKWGLFASKGVGLSLDIWPSRKALIGLLQNIQGSK